MQNRIKHSEDEYARLKVLNASGQLTQEQFDVLLKELRVKDAQGRWLMIGADSGKWYVEEGGQWVEADPSATQPATPRRPSSKLLVIVIGALVIVLLALGGVFVAVSQGLVNIGGILSAPTLVAVITTTPAPTATALPTVANSLPTVPSVSTATASLPTAAASIPTAAIPPTEPPTLPPTANVPSASPLPPSSTPSPDTPTVTPTIPTPLTNTAEPSPKPLPKATPIPASPPDVYVNSLRSDPAAPKNQQNIAFYASFVNSTGGTTYYPWCIEIFDPNSAKKNSFGVTSCLSGTIPEGIHEIKALDDTYHISSKGGCLPFRARAIWEDDGKGRHPFLKEDGSIFWYNFQVCP